MRRETLLAALVVVASVIAWAGLASRPGLWPSGCPDCHGAPVQSPRQSLRIVELNMLHGYPAFAHLADRIDLIVAEVERLDAEVVLLQEVPWTVGTGPVAETLAERLEMDHMFIRATGNRRAILFEEGQAILSRYPLRDGAAAELPWGDDFFEHRMALAATVETPWGPVRVVSTHLSGDPPEVSARQVAALRDFVGSSLVTVVGGDFNATAETPPMAALAGEWIDVLRSVHPDDPGLTCCRDDVTSPPGTPLQERIDYLWLANGSGARILGASRILDEPAPFDDGWLRASDHVGLFIELAFRS